METTSAIAAGLSNATTGTGSPDNMTIQRPSKEALWALFAAMGIVALIGIGLILILTWGPWTPATETERLHYLGAAELAAWLCIIVLVIAFASSRLGRVDASVGSNHIEISGTEGVH